MADTDSASRETQRENNEIRETDIFNRFSNLASHFNGWYRHADDANLKRKMELF
jgi:hypothetical protein